MIYIERTISITNNNASINQPVILYKGDRNVEIQFTLKNNPFKSKSGLTITHAQLIINRPYADSIFSDVARITSEKVLFVVTGSMIDELTECGEYDFQIRLLNEDQTSRATLAPVTAGIVIKQPICEGDSVDVGLVDLAEAADGSEVTTFDDEGNYNKTIWASGDLITSQKLNKIEDALYEINEDLSECALKTHTHDEYLTEHQSLDGYATEDYVSSAIENADLSSYALKTELPTLTSQLTNDSGYLTAIPDEVITESELETKGYLTEHQSLDDYATKTYVDGLIGDIESLLGGI